MAFAADAEGYKYIVWVFNGRFAISSPSRGKLPTSLNPNSLVSGCFRHSRKICFAPGLLGSM
jgi:hypothetical protein